MFYLLVKVMVMTQPVVSLHSSLQRPTQVCCQFHFATHLSVKAEVCQ